MSSLTRLKQALEAETAAEIEAINVAMQQKEAEIIKTARKKAEQVKAEVLAGVNVEIEELNRRADAEATLAQRRIMITAKSELVDAVMRKAADMFEALPEDRYRGYLVGLLLSAVPHQGETQVVLNEKDRARFGDALVREVRAALKDKGVDVGLSLSPEIGTMTGGFRLVGADFEVDASFERMLAGTGEKLEPEIAQILFANG